MGTLNFVLSSTVSMLCITSIGLLFLQSILSLIRPDADGPFSNFVYGCGAFLTAPMRLFLEKTGLFAGSPLDMAHFLTVLLLWVILSAFTIF